MINFDLLSLTPALIFATISAWINLVRMLDEISDVFNEPDLNNPNRIDDILRQRMHILAAEISSAPLLSIEKLKSILNVLGVSSYSQDVFLGFCAVWANRRLSDSEVTYLPEMTMPEVENLLKIIWPKLLTRFLNQGPLK